MLKDNDWVDAGRRLDFGAEKTRDPVFHLFANSIRVLVDDGAALHFTSFEHRDEALALIKKVAGGSRGPLE